ncbi:MAG: N-acyl homoserine lactonase family protein [Actinomycetota bacterium]
MRLIPLTVGQIEGDTRIVTGRDGTVTLPVLSWLIEHPDGLALFDNGMHVGLQADTSRLGRIGELLRPQYQPGEEVAARLADRGIRPDDIDLMVFSHLHFDHAGGTEQLPDARIVIQRDEWTAGQDQHLIESGVYDPIDYDHGHDVEQLDGEHDLFGDGRVRCLPTPGHTAGHQSLRVELASGPVILTGDCIYFQSMLDEMKVPRFGHDLEQQKASMRELAAHRDRGCRLLFGHDIDQLAEFPADGLV